MTPEHILLRRFVRKNKNHQFMDQVELLDSKTQFILTLDIQMDESQQFQFAIWHPVTKFQHFLMQYKIQ